MILIRFKNDQQPKTISYGDEETISNELTKLKLSHWESSFYCDKSEINNMILNDIKYHDFYVVCEDGEDLNRQIAIYNEKFKIRN
jgi:hypothetical protein